MATREICKLCYHVNPVGFRVPDDVWAEVVPDHVRDSVVCLSCFTRLGDAKEVPWDRRIEFFPASAASHRERSALPRNNRPPLSYLDPSLSPIPLEDPELAHFDRESIDSNPRWWQEFNALREEFGKAHTVTTKSVAIFVNDRFFKETGINVMRGYKRTEEITYREAIEYWGIGDKYLERARSFLGEGSAPERVREIEAGRAERGTKKRRSRRA